MIVEFWRGGHDERKINILSAGEINIPTASRDGSAGKSKRLVVGTEFFTNGFTDNNHAMAVAPAQVFELSGQ